MKFRYGNRTLLSVRLITASVAIFGVPVSSHAVGLEYAVYDAISGIENRVNGGFGTTGSSPRTFIGDSVNFYYPPSGPINITAIDLGFAYRGTVTTNFTALNLNLRFYEDTTDKLPDIFQAPVTNVQTFDVRQAIVDYSNALNNTVFTADNFVFTPNTIYFYQLVFSTPVTFADRNLNGVAINYSANAGGGLFADNTLTSAVRVGPDFAPNQGSKGIITDTGAKYLRNVSGRTDFNFNPSDTVSLSLGTFSGNSGVAMRLYSDVIVNPVVVVPEVSTSAMIAIGGIVPAALFFRRRRK